MKSSMIVVVTIHSPFLLNDIVRILEKGTYWTSGDGGGYIGLVRVDDPTDIIVPYKHIVEQEAEGNIIVYEAVRSLASKIISWV